MGTLAVEMLSRKRPELVSVLPRGALERCVFAAIAVCEPARAAVVAHWAEVDEPRAVSAIKRLLVAGWVEPAGWVRGTTGGRVQTYQVVPPGRAAVGVAGGSGG